MPSRPRPNDTLPRGIRRRPGRRNLEFWDRVEGAYRSAGTPDPKLAAQLMERRRLEAWKAEHYPELRPALEGATFDQLAKRWAEVKHRKKDLRRDVQKLQRMADHFGAHTRLVDIPTPAVRDYLRGLHVGPATEDRHRALLHAIFNLAIEEGWLTTNPVSAIKPNRAPNARDRVASDAELDRLVDEADPELRLAIVIAVDTGMRLGEIMALTPKDVDLDAGFIRVRDSKNKHSRDVPMTKRLRSELRDFEGWPRLTSDRASGRFRNLAKKCEIEDLKFHDLRHTALSSMRRAGVDPFTLAKISGHLSQQMLRRYQTVDRDDLAAAVRKLDGR